MNHSPAAIKATSFFNDIHDVLGAPEPWLAWRPRSSNIINKANAKSIEPSINNAIIFIWIVLINYANVPSCWGVGSNAHVKENKSCAWAANDASVKATQGEHFATSEEEHLENPKDLKALILQLGEISGETKGMRVEQGDWLTPKGKSRSPETLEIPD